jgi:hypothetical protein
VAQSAYPAESWDEWLAGRVVRSPFRRLPGRLLATLAVGVVLGFLVSRATTPASSPPPLLTGQPVSVAVAQLTEPVEKAFSSGPDPAGTVTVSFSGDDLTRIVREINAAPIDQHPDWAKSCPATGGFSFYRLRFLYANGDQATVAITNGGCSFIWMAGQYADRFGGAAQPDVDGLYQRAVRSGSAQNGRP